ncbi:xanthine dehydrogenase, molybdenum binding subunit apoprotein [Modestobacter sp. DSM 44400]|uniref:xanthine dehydrogenase family protein molybdopterin-binding subunit n=1 Tax=Modestobacter sp. DSM 44400 TaxID=1550230 RepID=UPI0008947D51|nr:xanthine dehydrogenase family protein molybdopterin-binding subunit [Modestobacter sp. DSM 44400]SDX80295.1 xanthine dehydrogenase, molybdenum binding subunit apoprotein [Modestobacter sp. DSM 44400]
MSGTGIDPAPGEATLSRAGRWIGASVPRREDPRLLTGRGRFVDDLDRVGLLHCAFVRSSVAAAGVEHLDLAATRNVDGVVAAYSAADLALGELTAILERPEFTVTSMPILAGDRVRYVGEPLAIVVAEDAYAAEDGVDAALVDYRPGTAITTMDQALEAGAQQVHAELIENTVLDLEPFSDPHIGAVFDAAACVAEVDVRTGRQNATPLEPRGCLAEWDARDEQLVVHVSTQVPHQVRTAIARCLRLPERSVRVIVPDVGGGFGLKCVVGREEVAAAAVALRLRRPVKWIEDRRDSLTASFHARQQAYRARAAFDADGRILALEADVRCDVGAYSVFPFTSGVEPLMAATELPGVYRVPRYHVRARGIATNKAPTAPYRGVSRPQIVLVMERLMERAARELHLDALDLRRVNLIEEFPYTGINGITYDPGSYRASLDLCEQQLRDEGWYDRRAQPTADGTVLGIGYACFNERTGYGTEAFSQRKMTVVPGYDIAGVRMDSDGTVSLTTGTSSHGQGHETTLAQVAADQLGLPPTAIKVRQGDTDLVTYGWGTFGSRSAAIGGGAVHLAAGRLGDKVRIVAAHLLDAEAADIELVDGQARHRDQPERSLSLAAVAEIAYLRAHRLPKGVDPGLTAEAAFDVLTSGTFSNATHGVVAALDPATGQAQILRYFVVEDCGVVINPRIVDGQVRGGVAQGIAGALFEEIRYDEQGQPTTSTLIDYLVPTATEIPVIDIMHLETPCTFTETGAKGMGEGGTIGAPAAVLNAVNDALRGTGVELDSVPIRPDAVHRALGGNS